LHPTLLEWPEEEVQVVTLNAFWGRMGLPPLSLSLWEKEALEERQRLSQHLRKLMADMAVAGPLTMPILLVQLEWALVVDVAQSFWALRRAASNWQLQAAEEVVVLHLPEKLKLSTRLWAEAAEEVR